MDGHVRASRSDYRNYVEKRFLDAFDDWARAEEAAGAPESGNLSAGLDPTSQWDSELRLKDMESQGVVAEVLFPNGLPFQARPADDVGSFSDPEIDRQARLAYNRWLADFCAQTPGRRAGQALISFDDVDLAVRDIHWAKEQGLGGVMMPALLPGGTFFFDPALDPVWSACVDVDLPISQHGGTGAPTYGPPGFGAIMTLALEHSFYSGRSLWQMILGGVFERFPDLRVAFVETEADWIAPVIRKLDRRLSWGDDWTGWAATMQRMRQFAGRPATTGRPIASPGSRPSPTSRFPCRNLPGRAPSTTHSPSVVTTPCSAWTTRTSSRCSPRPRSQVDALVSHPSITAEVSRKIMCGNAARCTASTWMPCDLHAERVGFDIESSGRSSSTRCP